MRINIHTLVIFLYATIFGLWGVFKANSQTISGKITDEFGHPLEHVDVFTANGENGTTSDLLGEFRLNVTDKSSSLIFSKYSFHSKRVNLEDKDSLSVILKKDVHGIDNIVYLGWDKTQKENLIGAVSSIRGSELEKSPVANLTLTFPGRFDGLTTQETYSELSRANTNLYIRGYSTSRAGGPLVVIDGIMVPYNANQTLDYISPDEIESVELLKDGLTQSMYGILGGNGVLLVKTKQGHKGALRVSVRMDHSEQQVTTSPTMLSAGEYAVLRQEAWENDFSNNSGYQPIFSQKDIEQFKDGSNPLYPNHNWYDYFFKKVTSMQRLGVNLEGGSDRVQFYTNLNFMLQNGFFKTDQKDYNPNPYDLWANFRSNVDLKINKYLSGSLHLSGNIKREHTPGESNNSIYTSIFHFPPTMYGPLTPLDLDSLTGKELSDSRQVVTSGDEHNPTYGMLNRRGYVNHTVTNIFAQFDLKLDLSFLTKGLSAKGVFAYQTNSVNSLYTRQDYKRMKRDISDMDKLVFSDIYSNENSTLSYSKGASHYYHISYQAQINYHRSFGKSRIDGTAYGFYQNLITAGNWYPHNRLLTGVKGKYIYDNRYMLELNTGYSGSGQFAPKKRFTFTPGVGAAWILTNENFMKKSSWLSFAKVRASWAKTATDQNGQGYYAYLDNFTQTAGGSIPYLKYVINESHYGNPDYVAEKIRKRNIGVDLGFLNMISFSVDVFDEYTDNMMVGATTATPMFQGRSLGSIPDLNIGKFKNKGFEISLNLDKQLNRNWSVNIGGHISKTKNKIVYNGEAKQSDDYIYPYRSQGFSVGQGFGYLIDYSNGNGYINTTDELENSPEYEIQKRLGDFLYQDLNEDGKIDEKDRVPLGTGSIPEYMYAFYGSLSYKNFDLSILFQGVGNYSRILTGWGVQSHYFEGIYSDIHKHAWTKERYAEGDLITYPALSTDATASDEANEFFVYDRSYLRLKNLEIGYSLPKEIIRKMGIKKLRIILSGQNLLTWDHMKTDDFGPEGSGFGAIPVYRVYNIGLNLSF